MYFHDIALILFATASEILGTLSGFGSSTFFVPLAYLIESFKFVLALTAILHCFGNFFKIVIFKEGFKWPLFFQLAIPSLIFTGLGALLTAYLEVKWLIQALGATLVLFSLLTLFLKPRRRPLPRWIASSLAAASGFFTGFVGTGGAIRGVALAALGLPKATFVTLSASIDIGGDLLRAAIYLKNGFMDWDQWFYIPLLAIAAFAGAQIGKKILGRINQEQFEKIVAVFILISGIAMIFQT